MGVILETIEQLKREAFQDASFDAFGIPESNEKLGMLADAKEVHLPEDYSAIMETYGECDITGPETNIIIFSADTILSNKLNSIERMEAFAFASDNGGSYYIYDKHDKMGKGAYAIFDIYPGNPDWKHATYLAPNLTVLIEKIVKGERFSP